MFLFDKSLTKYSGPLTARPLPDSVNFIGKIFNFKVAQVCLLLIFRGFVLAVNVPDRVQV